MEVRAQLPADTSDALLWKRIEQAKKLWKLFDAIFMDKIYRIHSFSLAKNKLLQNLERVNISPASQPIPKINSTHDCTYYFQNKTLDQYPNLYREFSSENFDYYGITDETSCLLCKLGHDNDESIEDRANLCQLLPTAI
ncbi:hypothetical protein GLOIN_2v1778864 [Rhizophagus irregularis DAOM 181602=DAOM 197198]|nr:hypothetical protein GLOIN_2v1778864 [Rhizophagus irregularis DAOM 181602=DAOM 197198]